MRALLLLLALAPAVYATDLKITTVGHGDRTEMTNASGEKRPLGEVFDSRRTDYSQGAMRRSEFIGFVGESSPRKDYPEPHMAVISNCATREAYTIDLDAREYREGRLPTYPSEAEVRARRAEFKARQAANPTPPNLLVESNTVDTGETAEMFGHTAHHLITTVKETPTGDLAKRMGIREETNDAWYIDLEVSTDCTPSYLRSSRGGFAIGFAILTVAGGGLDIHPSTTHTGPVPTGYPVKTKRTTHEWLNAREGKIETVSTYESEVTELSEAPLDPALFQVPPGSKKVEHLYRH